jgi:hypothetical protein
MADPRIQQSLNEHNFHSLDNSHAFLGSPSVGVYANQTIIRPYNVGQILLAAFQGFPTLPPPLTNLQVNLAKSLTVPILEDEIVRLATFVNWAHQDPAKSDLARAGFLFLGAGAQTKTFCCNLAVNNWIPGADPVQLHLGMAPQCAFIMELTTTENTIPPRERLARAADRRLLNNMLPPPGPPFHARFNSRAARQESFRTWPTAVTMNLEQMAAAGYFYEGKYDHVRCFHCNSGANRWRNDEDPFQRHARISPGCGYIGFVKGPEFVDIAHASDQRRSINDQSDDDLPSGFLCQICCFSHQLVLYKPCGHVGSCATCAMRQTHCPRCRQLRTGASLVRLH